MAGQAIIRQFGKGLPRQMRQLILTMLRVSYELGVADERNERVSREGHIAVAEAISARDPHAARAAMERRRSGAIPTLEPRPPARPANGPRRPGLSR